MAKKKLSERQKRIHDEADAIRFYSKKSVSWPQALKEAAKRIPK